MRRFWILFIPTATAALFWNQMEQEGGGVRPLDVQKHYRRMATLMCVTALPLNIVLTLAVFLIFQRLTLNAPCQALAATTPATPIK